MKKLFKKFFAQIAVLVSFLPIPAFAAYCSSGDTSLALKSADVMKVLKFGTCTLMMGVQPVLLAGAFIFFLYSIIKFISADTTEKIEQGRSSMIWSVIAIAVMVSVFGLVNLLSSSFGVSNVIPRLPT